VRGAAVRCWVMAMLLAAAGCGSSAGGGGPRGGDRGDAADSDAMAGMDHRGSRYDDIPASWDVAAQDRGGQEDSAQVVPEAVGQDGKDAAGSDDAAADSEGPGDVKPEGNWKECGNGKCEPGEYCSNCPQDCGSNCPPCGDGACLPGESCKSCPQDCGDCCGNGQCGDGETCSSCSADCGACCPNGVCDDMEDCASCPADCGACCGNGACDNGETCGDCPADCGPCCDPPNSVLVNGVCVPSCGWAGGNTCVPAGSAQCNGLPLLTSYDCAVCCFVPSYPGPSIHSYHTVHKDDVWSWDSIWALAQGAPEPGPMINSQNQPTDPVYVPASMWCQRIDVDWYGNGVEMAEAIHAAFVGANAPRAILIDELKSQPEGTPQKVADCANHLKNNYPQWQGRWGVWVVNGPSVAYDGLNPAIDALLSANAILSVEQYPIYSDYCGNGSTPAQRDQWLEDFFRGDQGAFPAHRFVWMMKRREQLGSNSHVSISFAVTDNYLNGSAPAVYLDRLFFVWRNKSQYGSLMFIENGGIGAWKWDDPDMSNTSRDAAFAESFNHYCVAKNTNSLKGQVPCP